MCIGCFVDFFGKTQDTSIKKTQTLVFALEFAYTLIIFINC